MDEQRQEDLPSSGEVRGLHELGGRVALVTGAAPGLGRAMAWGFACFGADVAIVDRDAAVAEAAAAGIAAATGRHADASSVVTGPSLIVDGGWTAQ